MECRDRWDFDIPEPFGAAGNSGSQGAVPYSGSVSSRRQSAPSRGGDSHSDWSAPARGISQRGSYDEGRSVSQQRRKSYSSGRRRRSSLPHTGKTASRAGTGSGSGAAVRYRMDPAAARRRRSRRARNRRLSITIIVCGLLNIAIIIGLIVMGVSNARSEGSAGRSEGTDSARSARHTIFHGKIDKNKDNVTANGFSIEVKDGVTFVDGIIIANKTYSLPEDYGSGLTDETQNAFNEMQSAAAADGISLSIASGFRSYETQKSLFEQYSADYGVDEAETFSARPGHSEHQIGEAMDINNVSQSFADTPAYAWLQEHAYEYGFIMRYLKDKIDVTGYMYEPWHYRYVGKELAATIYNNGDWLTLEEYFGITSEYKEADN